MQPDTFTVLLDAPSKPTNRIQIARLGSYSDARYGDFAITADNVTNWQKHLAKLPGGEALIDFEHRSERKPRDSEAAGWISGIDLEGDRVMADARWTSKGEDAIKDERYRFLSPVFGPTQVESETLDDALPSVALTNKPYLASMPAVCLASAERVSEAIDELTPGFATLLDEKPAAPAPERADSRPPDMPNNALLKLLDLGDDADDAKILEAVGSLKSTADDAASLQKQLEKKPRKTLEQQATAAGLIVLDAEKVATLRRQAEMGESAMKQLHAATFDSAFEKALNDPRGPRVKPAERESLLHFYELDAPATIKMIDEREPVVPSQPQGQPVLQLDQDADPASVQAAGLHPGSHSVHARIEKYMLDNGVPESQYATIFDKYTKGEVRI